MPQHTEYIDNSDLQYNHDPDFSPYYFEILVPEDVAPKGAVVVCAGGDHGAATFNEAYQTCMDFAEIGYQSFLLLNRTNRQPWSGLEAATDSARMIRIIRRNAAKYRIDPNHIAFAGFSNGGATGDACIFYYSRGQQVQEYFTDYIPDEMDEFSGAPNVMLCIYGARNLPFPYDYDKVDYPPTFVAYGRLDQLKDRIPAHYEDLVAHGVQTEFHTFTGMPHDQAGSKILNNGVSRYPSFDLWIPLANYFMQDVYGK